MSKDRVQYQARKAFGIRSLPFPSPQPSPLGRGRTVAQFLARAVRVELVGPRSGIRTARGCMRAACSRYARTLWSPLPEGEGQGEGEEHAQQPRMLNYSVNASN
jgi:hypothetical protein